MARRTLKMKWFVADLVMEIKVKSDARNVVHVNTVLVRALDLEQAYRRAVELGRSQAWKPYLNPAGQKVSTRFVGLRFLGEVWGALKHGVEIVYSEQVRVGKAALARMIRSKKDLLIPPKQRRRRDRPDYANGEVARDYENYVNSFKP